MAVTAESVAKEAKSPDKTNTADNADAPKEPEAIDFSWLAKSLADAMAISSVDNPHIASAEKKFGADFSELAKKLPAKKESLGEKEKALIAKLSDVKFGPLFYEIDGTAHFKNKIGESVMIRHTEKSPNCRALAAELRNECWKRGCHALCIPDSLEELRQRFIISPESALFEFSKISKAHISGVDVSISIGDEDNPNWSKGLENKLKFTSGARKARYAALEKSKIRTCLVGFPVDGGGFVEKEKYASVFYAALKETFSEKMPLIAGYYEKKLKGADKIRITAGDGTDLAFSLKGREILRDYDVSPPDKSRGHHYNFPSGEIFAAPIENSAEGAIIFDYATPSGFGLIRNLKLVFKKGKVVDFSADGDGAERFKKFLDANTGEKDRIGELGIGCNPGADFVGSTIVDEKIFGSIHIAIGWNRGTFKGKNEASSHLDMTKIMKGKNGNLYADGALVMKDGMPIERI